MSNAKKMLSKTLQKDYESRKYSDVIKKWNSSLVSPEQDPQSTYIVAASYLSLGNYEESAKLCGSIDGFYSNDINFLAMYAACLILPKAMN